ncbi:MAG: GFA family protein [Mangrovicoccus sp.]
MADPLYTGSCRCGDIHISLSVAPIITMACHCKGCQKMTASAFSLSALVPDAAVDFDGPEPVLGGAMNPDQRHYFCPNCMSWLYTRINGLDGFVNLRSSLLDDAAGMEPFVETCTAEKLPWAETKAQRSFDAMPTEEGFREAIGAYQATVKAKG